MSEQRKLAAILAADVVGFSRLAGADEDRTLARLRALRSDLIDPTIAVHRGRVVKRTGDGALVEFRSVVDAVRCAIEVQHAMVERNAGLPPERRIEFRIGIHLGDVVEESDGDLMGDGVNIAARLEGVAMPGAICLSEDAYRQVRARLDLAVSDLGETSLKNIAEPMRVYSLQVGTAARAEPAGKAPAADGPSPRPAMTDKPSIAVLPFTNMSGDSEQEYFVDGIVEDIITALSRFNQLFVIARNSTFTYKGRAVDVRKVAAELGVRYVLEGGVRKAGGRLRITGQLIDAATGAHLWADRFDGGLDDVFDLQDKITASVVGAIEPTMRKAEIERAHRKPVENLDAYDLYLRALPHVYAMRPEENLLALGLLGKAIEFEPAFAPALAHAAWAYEQRLTRAWPAAGPDDAGAAIALARRALAAGGDDAVSVVLAGFVLVMVARDYRAGLDAVRRALERNPGSCFVNFMAGTALLFGGDSEQSLAVTKRAMALGPLDPSFYMYLMVAGWAELFSGRPAEALELVERSAALNPDWDSTYWGLIPAYVQLDRLAEARAALDRFLSLAPGMTVSALRQLLPIRSQASLEMVLDGLRAAGLPD
jgi:adenylate cyclase